MLGLNGSSWTSLMVQSVIKTPANAGDVGSTPGSGRSPGEGNDNPLQYPCLGNPMDRQRSLVGYHIGGRGRVGHDLANKQDVGT